MSILHISVNWQAERVAGRRLGRERPSSLNRSAPKLLTLRLLGRADGAAAAVTTKVVVDRQAGHLRGESASGLKTEQYDFFFGVTAADLVPGGVDVDEVDADGTA